MPLANRVLETSVTSGTGDLVLDGAVLGYQTFVAALGDGAETYYTIWDEATGDWEIGIGSVAGGATPLLIRDEVLDSSAGDARVAFQAQQKYVFVDLPASERIFRDVDGTARMQRRTADQTEPLLALEDETGAVLGGIDASGNRFGSLTNQITEELTIGVVKTGGSATADPLQGELFDDLVNALAWCSRFRFAAAARIDVGAGEWTYSEPIYLSHPDGEWISIVGASPTVPLNSALTAPAATFEPDRNNPTYQARSGNMYNDAGQLPANASAAAREATRANDAIGNRAHLRSLLPTTLKFTEATEPNGLVIQSQWGGLANLYIEGGGSSIGSAIFVAPGCGLREPGALTGERCLAVSGFSAGFYISGGALLWTTWLVAFDLPAGFQVSTGGALTCSSITVQGCSNGVLCDGGKMAVSGSIRAAGCGSTGVLLSNGSGLGVGNIYADGNGIYGLYCGRNSSVAAATELFVAGSGASGVIIGNSYAEFPTGCQAVGNNQDGFLIQQGSSFNSGGQINARNNGGNGISVDQSQLGWHDLVSNSNGGQGMMLILATVNLNALSLDSNIGNGVYGDGSLLRAQWANIWNNVTAAVGAGNGTTMTFFAGPNGANNGGGNLISASNGSNIRVAPGAPFTYSPAGGVWGNNNSLIYN